MMRNIGVDEFLERLPGGRNLPRTEKAHPAVTQPDQDQSFLRPPLRVVEEGTNPTPPLIIISAPGAVGKTALARHIASQKNYFLWDLARLKLGDNSFVGTIAQCFGASNLQLILNSLQSGSVGFVFDAFDEAEILSGWQRVESFLDELVECTRTAPGPCLVLLARSETAGLVSLYVQEKLGACLVLEIDYFLEPAAKEFVGLQVEKIARERGQPELAKRHAKHKKPFDDAIDSVFRSIYSAFSVRAEEAWTNPLVRSFLGYAPVLQAVAAYVSSFTNYGDVEKRVREGVLTATGPSIAASIMDDLLQREQGKVVSALQAKGLPGAEGWSEWEALYSPQEQLERILWRVIKNEAATELKSNGTVPPWLAQHYCEAMKSFLLQHPFLRETDFSGPAFRDYTLASLLKSPREELRSCTRELMQKPAYVPTPLLIHFYRADGTELARGEDAGFFYESFSSRDTISNLSSATILVPPSYGANSLHSFELFDEGTERDVITLYIRDAQPVNVIFNRRLRNALIAVEGVITLGNAMNDFEITDSEVICQTVVIRSETFIVQSSAPSQAVRMGAGSYQQIPATVHVRRRGPGQLVVSWPGANQYPWATYASELSWPQQGRSEQESFLALRRILSWFKRDKKADLARHQDLIRKVAVGENPLRQLMLDFLLERGMIYKEEPLFKIEIVALSSAGLNYSDLHEGRATSAVATFLRAFEDWRSQGKEVTKSAGG